jgi:PAS domain S-box-containing protein
VRPVTFAGEGGQEFLDQIHVSWAEDEYGRGTAGAAIRSRRPAIGRDLLENPAFAAWRHVFSKRDYEAAIAVPLQIAGEVYGVLLVYAAEPDAFESTEVTLLEALGADISHGMTALRAEKERVAAMAALERARDELELRVDERTRELVERNHELEASRERYRELVENANSIILRLDTDCRVTFFNEYAQRFFGFGEEEILGRSVLGTIVPDLETTGRDLRELVASIAAHPERYANNENENVRRNGERVWLAWTNRPILDAAGRLSEILCIGNDISVLKHAEHGLLLAKEAAEAADRTKSAFLATMSHELRTPLNSIIGFSGILLRGLAGPLNDEQLKQLTMVQRSARHLLALINDVLDISKIEAGQLQIRAEPFALAGSLEKVVASLRPQAERKGLSLGLTLECGDALFCGDQRRIEQVLMNLLSNAVKFTDGGQVAVRAAVVDGVVSLVVEDTGVGIALEDQGGLFRPFHQLDQGLARRHEGTGLGLSICKSLVERMGGTITVQSRPGEGSTFRVRLPALTAGEIR